MPFTDEDRKRLREILKNEDNAKTLFAKNREILQREAENIKNSFENLIERYRDKQAALEPLDLIRLIGILAKNTIENIGDTLDITEISFLNNLETRKEKNYWVNPRLKEKKK